MDEDPSPCQVHVCWGFQEPQDQGPSASDLVLPGPSVHLLTCPSSGALRSVQKAPGDQEESYPMLSCLGLL